MANVKSDEVKQSLDDLERYRLFTEGKLIEILKDIVYLQKVNVHSQRIRPVWFLTPQDHAGRRNVSCTHTTSINSRRKKQPRNVFQKFFASVVQSWSGLLECLLIFGTYSVGCILGSYIFHGLNTLRKL